MKANDMDTTYVAQCIELAPDMCTDPSRSKPDAALFEAPTWFDSSRAHRPASYAIICIYTFRR